MKLSICIITFNEESNLPRCLASVQQLADEIVIVDSGSTDGTKRVAQEFGARWVQQPWLGFVGQKNFARQSAKQDWVLSLDADEECSPKLQSEIECIKQRGHPSGVVGFSMPRCVLYESRWIRHGDWYPDRLVRLFKRDVAEFQGGKVHERLVVSGPIQRLNGDLYHYSFANEADHRSRSEKYAKLWVESQQDLGRRPSFAAPYVRTVYKWFRGYILRRGFMDGPQGWKIARINAREVWTKYSMLRKANQSRQQLQSSR